MNQLTNRIYKLKVWRNCGGQDLVEYALAVGMVAMAGVAALPVMCGAVSNVFSNVGSAILANVR